MQLLDQPWTVFAVLLVVLLGVVELGYRIGVWLSVATDELRHEQLVASRDAVSVLLSLLLGFTMAMALSRFDERKTLIVDEANAIGTASLRAQMLPEPARGKILDLLRQYVAERIRYSAAALHSPDFDQALARGKQLQDQMWQQSVEVARQAPNPITSLFIQALGESMDLSEKRISIVENRVPAAIWVMLILISLLTCITVGMSVRRRFWFVMVLTPLMIAIVMSLIADLNSPRSGFIQVGKQSMERAQQDLQAPSGTQ